MDTNKYIFDFLFSRLGNEIGAAALMGNLYVESKLQSVYLESSYARKFKLTSEEYTEIFDRITDSEIDTFCHDKAGYGLVQWTYWSRKKNLWLFAKRYGKSVGDLTIQLEFMLDELQGYKTVLNALKTAKNLREASDVVALKYEKPSHTEEKYLQNRAKYGQQFYDQFSIKMEEKGGENGMNTLAYVNQKIVEIKQKEEPLADKIWETARLCEGWPYIFGDRGQQCTPAQRRNVYNKHPDQDGLISKCQALSKEGGKAVITGGCSGCKWYPGGSTVGSFDCRGFTYWSAHQYGIDIMGAGATSQWNTASNWAAKGTIDTIPDDKLVCLFYPEKKEPQKMAHTGFGYHGATIECGNGVVYTKVRNKKWTHWAIPKGLYDGDSPIIPPVDPTVKLPTLRKGDKGQYVSLLQTLLLSRGYSLPKYGADGSFGKETETAVIQFQRDWGLKEDGIVGEDTWKMLETSPEKQKLYTVTILHLTKEEADNILKQYTGTMNPET